MNNIQDDIEKYNNGELSPAEMHALEKKALSDPFLADALDGITSIASDEFNTDLKTLRTTLHQKTSKEDKGGSFNWTWTLRIAAGVVLLAVSGYILNSLFTRDTLEPETLALNKQEEKIDAKEEARQKLTEADTKSIEQERAEPKVSSTAKPIVTQPNEQKDSPVKSDVVHEEVEEIAAVADDSEIEDKEIPIVSERSAAGASQTQLSAEDRKLDKADALPLASTPAEKSVAKSSVKKKSSDDVPKGFAYKPTEAARDEVVFKKTIKGNVTDVDDGVPIPGVNVLVKGTIIGTVTDLNGNYELSIPVNQNGLIFSYIGMETKEVSPDSLLMDVQLSPDVSALSEVVVVGYGTEGEEFEGTKWELAEPDGGRKEYKRYLEQSITYPKLALANDVEGKVSIQFTIQPSGQLTDFRVVKGLGFGCDEEVIRLIKEGPKWKPTKRNDEPVKGKGKVKMKFNLPNKSTKDK